MCEAFQVKPSCWICIAANYGIIQGMQTRKHKDDTVSRIIQIETSKQKIYCVYVDVCAQS